MDLIFVAILGYQCAKITRFQGAMDFIASCMAMMIPYALIKAIPLGLMGGWTWPFSHDPNIQLISGAISFALLFGVIAIRCKTKYGGWFKGRA